MSTFIDGDEPEVDFFDPAVQLEQEAKRRVATEDNAEEAHRLLRRRQEAYTRVFVHGAPMGDDVDVVMKDLAKFCRAYDSTFHVDSRVHAMLEGRREVFMRIMDYTRLDHDTLFVKYTRG